MWTDTTCLLESHHGAGAHCRREERGGRNPNRGGTSKMTIFFEVIQRSENADWQSIVGNRMTEERETQKLKAWGPNSPRGAWNSDHNISMHTAQDKCSHRFFPTGSLGQEEKRQFSSITWTWGVHHLWQPTVLTNASVPPRFQKWRQHHQRLPTSSRWQFELLLWLFSC